MNAKKCPQCGTQLDDQAPEGLCPACLMKAGIPTDHDTVADPFTSDPLAPAEIAKHFPQLEIIELLGRGGMGVVYKARQKQLDRIVALKVLPPDVARDPHFAERFLREARALAKLNHPSIVTVYEFGESGGLFFLIMEFVDGANLRQLEQSRRLTPAEALAIIPKICDALQYAHEEGVVHRDIKPENILVDKRGRVKIADFGLAKLLGRTAADVRLTQSNLQMGTPHYMAPEQMEKPLTVDHRADIYSLGVVFYELLTGELPLGRFAPPSSRGRGMQIDVRLDEVVLHALERDPERRYQHVSEVKTDVENITQGGPSPAASNQQRRRKVFLATAAAAALLLAVGLFAIGNRFFGKQTPPSQSTTPATSLSPQTDFTYTNINGTITITKYTGPGGAVTIPSTINGLPVTSIGNGAFIYCDRLTSITIPNTVKNIEDNAFYSCNGLTNAMIGNSVTNIEGGAFHYCHGLTSVTIPASVTSMRNNLFAGSSRLTSIVVNAANPAYSSSADGVLFNKEKTKLVGYPNGKDGSYLIPNSVTSIGSYAFSGCHKLTKVTIPASVITIGVNPFSGMGQKGEVSIFVDAANPAYSSTADGVLFNKEKTCLVSYPAGKTGSYEIPSGVTKINEQAFEGCSYLTSVTIPESVTSIDIAAFCRCDNLTGIYFKGNAPWFGQAVFDGTKKATIYYLPGATGYEKEFGGRPTAVWNAQTPVVETPAAIPQTPFTYTTNNNAITITKYTGPGGAVTIPSTLNGLPVTSIGYCAFWFCNSLTNVTIPNSVTNIGVQAFGRCAGLSSVSIPNSVTSIEALAFDTCTNLTNVTIPKSVTSIGGNPFRGCSELTSISVDAANPAFTRSADGVVFNKEETRLVIYPSGKVGSYVIPNSVTNITAFAFSGCMGLPSITIPASVTSIDDYPFVRSSGLTSIMVDAANPAYSSSADGVLFNKEKTCLVVYPAGKAGSYVIPNGVAKISQAAFLRCTNLTSVTIPDSVTTIDSEVFHGCDNLTGIYFKSNVPKLGQDVFEGVKKATIYYQPGTTGWGPEFGGRPTAIWKP